MADPVVGRAGQSGHSPRLGAKDPRIRSNAAGAVGDPDLDQKTLGRDGSGKTRFKAWDALTPLSPTATTSEIIAKINAMLARAKGLT